MPMVYYFTWFDLDEIATFLDVKRKMKDCVGSSAGSKERQLYQSEVPTCLISQNSIPYSYTISSSSHRCTLSIDAIIWIILLCSMAFYLDFLI